MTHGDMNLPLQPASPSWINHLQRALVEGGGGEGGGQRGEVGCHRSMEKKNTPSPVPLPSSSSPVPPI